MAAPGKARRRWRTTTGPTYPTFPVTSIFKRAFSCVSCLRSNRPGSVSGCPELFQVLLVALRIHARSEVPMGIDAELPVAGEAHERFALQDAVLVVAEIGNELALEEEIAAVDPLVLEVRLLA